MGQWFAGSMWSEHPALNDFGNWAAPLALGVAFGAPSWGVAPGWYGPGLWPASLRDEGWTMPMYVEMSKHQGQAGSLPHLPKR